MARATGGYAARSMTRLLRLLLALFGFPSTRMMRVLTLTQSQCRSCSYWSPSRTSTSSPLAQYRLVRLAQRTLTLCLFAGLTKTLRVTGLRHRPILPVTCAFRVGPRLCAPCRPGRKSSSGLQPLYAPVPRYDGCLWASGVRRQHLGHVGPVDGLGGKYHVLDGSG